MKTNRPLSLFKEDIDDDIILGDIEAGKYDGSYPLDNAKYERLVQDVFSGVARIDAYKNNVSRHASDSTAKKECSNILKRPEVSARLEFLNSILDGMVQPVTMQAAMKMCSDIMNDGDASADNKLKALDRIAKMRGWFNSAPDDPANKNPDPAYFYEFIKRANSANSECSVCPCCGQTMPSPAYSSTEG